MLIAWVARDLLLLLFGGVLLALALRTAATGLAARTRLQTGAALAVVVLLLVAALVGTGFLFAPRLAEQADQLRESLPMAVEELTGWLQQYGWGVWLLDQLASTDVAGEDLTTPARRVADAVLSLVVGAAVILFVGLYLAADPWPYLRGLLRLVPPGRRARTAETVFAVGYVLRWWLVGQALAMALVGAAMGIGLAVIGVSLALVLGALAGLLEFIPLVGPVLAVGPALLLAGAADAQRALYVLLLYSVVQTAESYVITPLVQRRVVNLPPALTITAQVAMSWAAGALGLLLAVPLTASLLVIVQMLYVRDRLGSPMSVQAEEAGRQWLAETPELREIIDEAQANRD